MMRRRDVVMTMFAADTSTLPTPPSSLTKAVVLGVVDNGRVNVLDGDAVVDEQGDALVEVAQIGPNGEPGAWTGVQVTIPAP